MHLLSNKYSSQILGWSCYNPSLSAINKSTFQVFNGINFKICSANISLCGAENPWSSLISCFVSSSYFPILRKIGYAILKAMEGNR